MSGRLYTVVRGSKRILYREVSAALPCFPTSIEVVRVQTHPLLKPLDPLMMWLQTPNKEDVRSASFVFASGISLNVNSESGALVDYLR
jgi:hypothetical protein